MSFTVLWAHKLAFSNNSLDLGKYHASFTSQESTMQPCFLANHLIQLDFFLKLLKRHFFLFKGISKSPVSS